MYELHDKFISAGKKSKSEMNDGCRQFGELHRQIQINIFMHSYIYKYTRIYVHSMFAKTRKYVCMYVCN